MTESKQLKVTIRKTDTTFAEFAIFFHGAGNIYCRSEATIRGVRYKTDVRFFPRAEIADKLAGHVARCHWQDDENRAESLRERTAEIETKLKAGEWAYLHGYGDLVADGDRCAAVERIANADWHRKQFPSDSAQKTYRELVRECLEGFAPHLPLGQRFAEYAEDANFGQLVGTAKGAIDAVREATRSARRRGNFTPRSRPPSRRSRRSLTG